MQMKKKSGKIFVAGTIVFRLHMSPFRWWLPTSPAVASITSCPRWMANKPGYIQRSTKFHKLTFPINEHGWGKCGGRPTLRVVSSFISSTIVINLRDRYTIPPVIWNCTAKSISLDPKGDFKADLILNLLSKDYWVNRRPLRPVVKSVECWLSRPAPGP